MRQEDEEGGQVLLCGGEAGRSSLTMPGGRGCWGNMLAGRGWRPPCSPPGKVGKTAPGGRGRGWPSMAVIMAGGGLERSWGAEGGGMEGGREMEASLNRCSVKEALWWGMGARGIRVRKGRLGTM